MKMANVRLKKVKRQLSFRNLRRRITCGRSASESMTMIDGEDDVDHLLENCEPLDVIHAKNSENSDKDCNKSKALSLQSSQDYGDSTEEFSSNLGSSNDKYKIPSSIIALNDEEKKRLEYVLLQISLREVGLG